MRIIAGFTGRILLVLLCPLALALLCNKQRSDGCGSFFPGSTILESCDTVYAVTAANTLNNRQRNAQLPMASLIDEERTDSITGF